MLNWGRVAAITSALALGTSLTGCGTSESTTGSSPDAEVYASFYPLEFIAARLLDGELAVANLTPAGGEPHDLELSASGISALGKAQFIVYLSGLQPSLDKALDTSPHGTSFDARQATDVQANDPHFWLDPTKLAAVSTQLSTQLVPVVKDPQALQARATALAADLNQLDQEFATELARCPSRALVTSHDAFGYLARRYQLTTVPITGIDPHQEPTPKALATASAAVRDAGASTIFAEELLPTDLADTVAAQTGAHVDILSTLEARTPEQIAAGQDYLSIMRDNLTALKKGLGCS